MAALINAVLWRRGLEGSAFGRLASRETAAIIPGCYSITSLHLAGPMKQDRRGYQHRGVLKLRCSECRYVIRRWHVPILAVDCNANVRHKQALTNPAIRSRWSAQFPDDLAPWIEGKQYPRHPHYRQENTFQCYHKKRHLRLR
eukprot:TRINITY_DN18562_c0_g1_i1.p1 TRINITY_DN18562_c0_g1~~TRINITY_DN18562_c0_g1_i1.p1  ORF type:complete len:143 (-),score=12.65 TRINITY_DN18562_c0_g1_i1:85-513(-)